jgi:prophage antirepressor-like protein
MSTSLTALGSRDILGKIVIAYGTVENPLFLAKDVAEWIEHSNTTVMVQPVDSEEVVVLKLNETLVNPVSDTSTKQCLGQVREYTFLTENGLYEVLFLSRKPVAKEFKVGVKKLLHDLRLGKATVVLSGLELVAAGYSEAMKYIESQQLTIEKQQKRIEEAAPKERFHDLVKYSNVLCHFQGLANVLFNNGIDIGRNRLIRDFRGLGDIQQCKALFTQKALSRNIGQNVQTGMFDHSGVTQMSFRAFLNHRGICEVFDRYGLTQDQRVSVMKDMAAADEPFSAEVGEATLAEDYNSIEAVLPAFLYTNPTLA